MHNSETEAPDADCTLHPIVQNPNLENYFPGKGCMCLASSALECACDNVDWTPKEVYELRANLYVAQKQGDILLAAVTDAIARFDKVHWGWDGDCGSSDIFRRLEDARDAVLNLNPGHHDGAAPAPSVDGVVGGLNDL